MVSPLFSTPVGPLTMPAVQRTAPNAKFLIEAPLRINVARSSHINRSASQSEALTKLAHATKPACHGCRYAHLERSYDALVDVDIYSVTCTASQCKVKIDEARGPITPLGVSVLDDDAEFYREMRDLAMKIGGVSKDELAFLEDEVAADIPQIEGAGAW